jgi:hypothetical protein
MLLIEIGKGHLAQNKSENFVGSFASWEFFPSSREKTVKNKNTKICNIKQNR